MIAASPTMLIPPARLAEDLLLVASAAAPFVAAEDEAEAPAVAVAVTTCAVAVVPV